MTSSGHGFFWAALSALFAVAFLGERPSLREWAGIAPVTSGVMGMAPKR